MSRERARLASRRARVEALRSWIPWPAPGRRVGRLRSRARSRSRRPRAERAAVFGAVAAVQVLTWLLTGSWPLRITVAVLTVLAVPALTTLTFDRSNNR